MPDWFMGWLGAVQKDFIQNFIDGNRWRIIVKGLGLTLELSVLAAILGIIIGFLLALAILSKWKILQKLSSWYIDIIRGTPMVTQLLIIYFVVFGSVRWQGVFIAAIAFGMNSGAYVAEIVRAGILSVDHGQTEAGRSLGLSSGQTMVHIIIPQALKNIFPALANELIVLIKETAVAGYIPVMDLSKGATLIQSQTFAPFMPLLASALIYFIIIKLLTRVFKRIEKRLRRSDVR